MTSIFDYLDFRKFLQDYFAEQKSIHPCFSYKYLANKAGLRNKGFIYNIVNGSKKLSSSNVFKLCEAMELGKKECAYFENLVFFNQAGTPVERHRFFKQMETIKEQIRRPSRIQMVRKDQYELYSNWYHSAVRAIIGRYPGKIDFQWLGRQLYPVVKGKDVKKSIELLVRLGLLRHTAEGAYKLSNATISTGHEVQSVALLNFYLQHLSLATDALKTLSGDRRRFEGITLGISRKSYDLICAEFKTFIERTLSIAAEDKEADCVYQLMLQLYPLSKNTLQGELS